MLPYEFPFLSIWLFGVIVLGLLFQLWRRVVVQFNENRGSVAQVQAMFQLFSGIKFRKTLPAMRIHAISPDFLNLVADEIRERKPKIILECGAGVSTIVNGYLLEANGIGMVHGLEHAEEYAIQTNMELENHLLEHWGKVHYAPLKNHQLPDGKTARWYDLSFLEEMDSPIDILIIDGPESYFTGNSRYPALPLLAPYLSKEVVIFIDDGRREKEQVNAKQWVDEFPGFTYHYYYTEKGTIVLRR